VGGHRRAAAVLLLRDWHGLNCAELAEVLGLSIGTASVRIHPARQWLHVSSALSLMTAAWQVEIRRMLSAFLDGELTQGEQQRVRVHLEDCAACRREYEEMARLQEMTRSLPLAGPPEDRMNELGKSLMVQAPRRLGWLLVLGGLAAWLIYAAVMYVRHWRPPTAEQLIAAAVVIGLLMLLVSVIVERLRQLPHDRYWRIEK
jgi:anti-sigma factor RsiW